MPNYLTINKSITEMSEGERLDLVRHLRHLREVSHSTSSNATKRKVQKKKSIVNLIQSMSLDELLKMQAELEE